MARKEVELSIFRFDPQSEVAPHYDRVKVEVDPQQPVTVLDILLRVQQQHLPDLALSYSCRAGQCGSCTLKIDGVNRLACKTMVDKDTLTIEPRDNCEVIRDLVVDAEGDLERLLEGWTGFRSRLKPPHRIKPEEYSRLSGIRECIECLACMSACPVRSVTDKYKGPMAMRSLARFAFDPRTSDVEGHLRHALRSGCHYCTACRRCTYSCDKGIDIAKDSVVALRRGIYQDSSLRELVPKNIVAVTEAIEGAGNLFRLDNIERADIWSWQVEDELDLSSLVNREAKVAYFVGCLTSFKVSLDFIAQNTVRILHRIGEDFTILGPEEFCCGLPSHLAGAGEKFLEQNIRALEKLGIERLLCTCPGCYKAFKILYPERLGHGLPFQVLHLTEYISQKLDAGDLRFAHAVPLRAAWHDPCDLGRHCGVYDEPRRILKEAGVEVVELGTNRDNSRCCGQGGLLPIVDEEVSIALAKQRIQEVRDAGVSALVTACPSCLDQFRKVQDGLELYDISEIILKAL